jgi:hypothetical protein
LASVSSARPTSSNFSSSVGGGFSKLAERMEQEFMREKRESRDVRDGVASGWWIGERAEISWGKLASGCLVLVFSRIGIVIWGRFGGLVIWRGSAERSWAGTYK